MRYVGLGFLRECIYFLLLTTAKLIKKNLSFRDFLNSKIFNLHIFAYSNLRMYFTAYFHHKIFILRTLSVK